MSFIFDAKELSKKLTVEYIEAGNVSRDDIQKLRDCVIFLLGTYDALTRTNRSMMRKFDAIKEIVDEYV